ncbi:MAG: hypothetical protein GC149_03495 [Gammaproteobacteria bacterium]|nr:hypothetical protein [Gammaproteobacteria bacterium]
MSEFTESSQIEAVTNIGDLTLSPQIMALLQELQDMLSALIERGEESRIDIRSLPLPPGDHDLLMQFLGEGEVKARIDALGMSEIKETRFSGIWWLLHYNTHDEIMAEIIEVTQLPDILKTQVPDLIDSRTLLKKYLQTLPSHD